MSVQTKIQVRRGALSTWNAASGALGYGILYQGELGYETDSGRFKIGDGTTSWSSLNYASVLPASFVAGSGISLTSGTNGSTLTISLSDPTIQVSDITDFAEGVDDRVSSLLQAGTGVYLSYNDGAGTLTINSSVGLVLEDIQDTIGTNVVGGSGISVSYDDTSGNTTISLNDPTIQLADITDLSSNARTFLSTPSSSNLSTLVTDETGSGALVFANSPTLISPTLGVASATSVNKLTITAPTTSATLTIADGKTLTSSNSLTFTGTDSSSVVCGSGGTVAYAANNLGAFASTSSSQLAGVISDETGTGSLVFANNPTMSGVTVNGNLTVSGSGLVASNINNFDTAVRTSRLDQMAVPTSSVSLNSQKITSLAEPTNDQDAATKSYVDAARSGLDVKQSVRVATTEFIALSGTQTIDDVSVIAGNRVLVKDQGAATNGIYDVAAGSWSRSTDADSSAEVTAGMFTFVSEGTENADSGWVLTTNDTITLETTVLSFAQFSGAGQITAGSGLTKSGNTLNVGTASSSRIVVNSDDIDLATITQSDSSGSDGSTFVQSVTRDGYGRVSGVITAAVQNASTSVKGIASFDSGDFSVTSGAVIIKAAGVDNSQLVNSSVTVGSTSISLGASATTIAGLSSVTSTSFVGALTGNASTATTLATARTINGTSFDGSANITIEFIDGGTP